MRAWMPGAAVAVSLLCGLPSGSSAESPWYVPPPAESGAPGGRLGGVMRGVRADACDAKVSVLVPKDHRGLTLEAQPVFYFFLSADTRCTVEFVLNDRRTVPPLVESAVRTPGTAGLHAIRLADFGVSLEKDVDYDWFVQLRSRTEKPAPDTYGGGQIRRVAAPADLPAELTKVDARRAQVLAQRSLWYDALAALSGEIDASPGDATLHAQRAGLLESVGLGDTAASDRRRASTQP